MELSKLHLLLWEGVAESKENDFGFFRLQFVTFSKDILLDVFLAAKMLLFFSRIFTMFFFGSDR